MNNPKISRMFLQCILTMLLIASALNVMGQSPPTAATGAASGVGSTDAILNGTVNANGETTSVIFEYGLDTQYGSSVPAAQSPVTGSTDTSVSVVIYELSPNTTYHFRVMAQSVGGATYGVDMTFTTLPLPPDVFTNGASGIGADSATLNGSVNPRGGSTTVTFEYGTDTSYGTTVTADQSPLSGINAVSVSKTITGLAAGTTYHYRVVATNAGGTSYGADMTFTINAQLPTAVTNAATAVGSETATLNGTVNASGSVTTVTFEYGLDTNYGSTATAIQNPVSGTIDTAVSVIIDDVLPNTTYHYRVVATNAGGTANGVDMTFTTLPFPPTAVTNMASSIGTTGATLNGTVNANDGSTTVTFQYGLDTSYGTTVTADQSPVTGSTDTAVSNAISGLANNTTYHYRVVAVNAGGTTYGVDMTFTTGTAAPTATTNAASGVGTTSATFNGTVNANNDSTTVTFEYGTDTSYSRTVTADQSPVTGSSNTVVSKTVSELAPKTTYYYRLVAQNSSGTTYGAGMTFTTKAAPTVITNTATAVSASGGTLNGTVNANGDSTTVTFEYGLTTAYGTTVAADQNPVTGNTVTAVSKVLTGLTANTTYHYRVVGVNANGTTYGVDMTFFTAAPAAPTAATMAATLISSSGATLNGTVNANNADTTVTFEYGTTTSYGNSVTADQSPVSGAVATAVSKAIVGLSNNTTYHYRVVAVNAHGTTYGSDMTFSTGNAPGATTDPATAVGASFATLNGTVNANNFTTIVTFEYGTTTSYGTTVTADQSPVTGTDNTPVSKTITGLLPTTTYHYRVRAQGYGTTYGADMTFTTGSGPTATTGAATSITATAATLNGTVNANNASTTVTFEYGLNTSYGKVVTADQSPVTGSADTAVSKHLTSLVPDTTYHYRVVASNANDTVYGADMTFTTPGSAPTATTKAAADISDTGATLQGAVNPRNDSTTVTFQYGTDTSYGSSITAAQSPLSGITSKSVSAVLTGLTSNTTYHYRVVAQNSFGTTYGSDLTFFTASTEPTATTQAATDIGTTSATLNGLVNANNKSTTVTFQFGPDTGYGRTVTAAQSPVTGSADTAVSVNVTALAPSTTYHFRVVATNISGTVYGADMTFFTGALAPSVTTAAASNIDVTSATLNGLVNANNASTTVTFQYGTDTGYGTSVTADQSPVTGSSETAVSVNVTGLAPDTTYHFRAEGENSQGTTYGADMTFTTDILRIPTVTTAPVTKVTFHTAKSGGNVTDEGAAPVTARGVCWSTSPNPTIADRFTINDSGPGPFNSLMNKLTEQTTYYVRAYATNSYGTAYGEELQFTTDSKNVSVTIVQPRAGDEVSGITTIKVNAKGTAGSQSIAKVEVYIDDTKIAELTKVPFKVHWDTTTYSDGSHTIKAVAYNENNDSSQESIQVTVNNSVSDSPELSTNRNRLFFAAVPRGKNGYLVTGVQTLLIDNLGGGTLKWSISTDTPWLSVSPNGGKGSHMVKISVDPQKGMAAGSYSGSLRITAPNTSNGTVTVDVHLTIYQKGATTPPFGSFETPEDGAAVTGNISISGWVLDDIEVTAVKIYQAPQGKKGGKLKKLGNAVLVDGARVDIEKTYPDYPLNYQAGWGYLLMTNLLPNQGNGTFTLVAKATDKEGNTVTLDSKTITVDNASAVEPFGTIDTPGPGETVAGSNFVNFGWALTPQPNTIPTDGSTIIVWVDGVPLGSVVYNRYRKDIATQFPGFNNSNGAGGYFYLDTTAYTNGVHTIAWSVKDDAGNMAGIGSRYFTIFNSDSTQKSGASSRVNSVAAYTPNFHGDFSENLLDEIDTPELKVKELQHVEFQVSNHFSSIRGYLSVDGKFRPLPIGSTLDQRTGRFYWDPCAGFVGLYKLVFVIAAPGGDVDQKIIEVTIEPKFKKIN